MLSDEALVRQVLAGQTHAFRFLVLRYQRPLFKFLSAFRLDEARREELAQEAFLRAFRSLAEWDPRKGASFATWLFTIARNLAVNEVTKSSSRLEEARESLPETAVQPQVEDRLALREALGRIPEDFRNAVVLATLQELSVDEIAQIESCSVGTVKSRIFRGKQLLRALLAPGKEVKA